MSTYQPAPGAVDAVRRAAAQFNAEQFWECHETIEEFWGDEHGLLRDFYHGLIQVAAGFVHVQRHNWHGAVRLLGDGAEKLAPFRPSCLGVQLEPLLAEVAGWRALLARQGPDGMRGMVARTFPKVQLSAVGDRGEE